MTREPLRDKGCEYPANAGLTRQVAQKPRLGRSGAKSERFRCAGCGRRFTSWAATIRHVDAEHRGGRVEFVLADEREPQPPEAA
jgi:hypothetical protein